MTLKSTAIIKIVTITYLAHFHYAVDTSHDQRELKISKGISNRLLCPETDETFCYKQKSDLQRQYDDIWVSIEVLQNTVNNIVILRNYQLISGLAYLHILEIFKYLNSIGREINYTDFTRYLFLVKFTNLKSLKYLIIRNYEELLLYVGKNKKYHPKNLQSMITRTSARRKSFIETTVPYFPHERPAEEYTKILSQEDKDLATKPNFVDESYEAIRSEARALQLLSKRIESTIWSFTQTLTDFSLGTEKLSFDQISKFLLDIFKSVSEEQSNSKKVLKEDILSKSFKHMEGPLVILPVWVSFTYKDEGLHLLQSQMILDQFEEYMKYYKTRDIMPDISQVKYNEAESTKQLDSALKSFLEVIENNLGLLNRPIELLTDRIKSRRYAKCFASDSDKLKAMEGRLDDVNMLSGIFCEEEDITRVGTIILLIRERNETKDNIKQGVAKIKSFINKMNNNEFDSDKIFETEKSKTIVIIRYLNQKGVEIYEKARESYLDEVEYQKLVRGEKLELYLELLDAKNLERDKLSQGHEIKMKLMI